MGPASRYQQYVLVLRTSKKHATLRYGTHQKLRSVSVLRQSSTLIAVGSSVKSTDRGPLTLTLPFNLL